MADRLRADLRHRRRTGCLREGNYRDAVHLVKCEGELSRAMAAQPEMRHLPRDLALRRIRWRLLESTIYAYASHLELKQPAVPQIAERS